MSAGGLFLVGVAELDDRGSGPGWGSGCRARGSPPPSAGRRRPRRRPRRRLRRARRAAVRLISSTRSSRPYSARTTPKAPKALVSTTSHPDVEEGAVDRGLTTSGRWQDDGLVAALEGGAAEVLGGLRSASCRLVPMAPSKMTTRWPGGLEIGGAAFVDGHGAVRQDGGGAGWGATVWSTIRTVYGEWSASPSWRRRSPVRSRVRALGEDRARRVGSGTKVGGWGARGGG